MADFSVVREGVLFQRQKQTWKERYFVLSRDGIVCYKNSTREELDTKGNFDLSSHAHLEVMPEDQQKTGSSAVSKWRFSLTAGGHRCIWVS
jgi:hypothetical protein